MEHFQISSETLTFSRIQELLEKGMKVSLSSEAIKKIQGCRDYLDNKMKTQKEPIYGINTGFGSLCNITISNDELETLQRNLVMSHACGMGDEVPQEIVKIMLLLKVQGLSYGNSGVQLSTVERLLDFYNNDVLPVIYTQGSLGASGDLSPLAHLCLPMLGLGEVNMQGKRVSGAHMLKVMNWQAVRLQSKEGLALLNGTQFMSSYGVYLILQAQKLSAWADTCGALSLEAFDGRPDPFSENIQNIRPHAGQIKTAANIRNILSGSELLKRKKEHVQDPYSFRCIPQVHGASKDVLNYVEQVFLTEINSVTDNPTVFPDTDEIISGGNFHGQPLAIALDMLCIGLSELGNISERRTYQLISGLRGLPAFLVAKPGLNSGFMIPQYTAASIVSQNKQLCSPASADSIVSSNGQEDHVSMGANAATKAFQVTQNLHRILAIELLNAAQAIEFRRPAKSSDKMEELLSAFRSEIDFITNDVYMHEYMMKSAEFMNAYSIKGIF